MSEKTEPKDENLEYLDKKVARVYELMLAHLEVDVAGVSMLINNEQFIKDRLNELVTIGYERKITELREFNQRIKNKPVLQINLAGEVIAEFISGREAAKKIGVNHSTIHKSVRHGHKTKGHYFVLKEDYNRNK